MNSLRAQKKTCASIKTEQVSRIVERCQIASMPTLGSAVNEPVSEFTNASIRITSHFAFEDGSLSRCEIAQPTKSQIFITFYHRSSVLMRYNVVVSCHLVWNLYRIDIWIKLQAIVIDATERNVMRSSRQSELSALRRSKKSSVSVSSGGKQNAIFDLCRTLFRFSRCTTKFSRKQLFLLAFGI